MPSEYDRLAAADLKEERVAKVLAIRPLPGKVVVEVTKEKEKMKSGLIIAPAEKQQMNQGKVIAVYEAAVVEGESLDPYVKLGDYVVFGRYAGTVLTIEGDDRSLMILRETDILTVLDYDIPPVDVEPTLMGEVPDVVGKDPILMELESEQSTER